MSEQWYKIKNVNNVEDNKYEVSNLGRVRKGTYILKTTKNLRGGYPTVTLYNSETKKSKFICVHTLMKYSIFNNTNPKVFINHKDGVKSNNDLDNLELSNALHNTHHAIDMGLFKATKVETDTIYKVREFIQTNSNKYTYTDLAKLFNITGVSINRIVKGSIRKDLKLEDLSRHILLRQRYLDENKTYIIKDLINNMSLRQVAFKYRCDPQTIKKIFKEYMTDNKLITSTTSETNKCNS